MQFYHVIPDISSLAVHLVLLIYLKAERKILDSRLQRKFLHSLVTTILVLSLNILTCLAIIHKITVPYYLNFAIQSLWFFFVPLEAGMLAGYIISSVYASSPHSYREHAYTYAFLSVFLLNAVFVLLNFKTGWLFRLDGVVEQYYVRGPLNFIPLSISAFVAAFCMFAIITEQKHITPQLRRLVKWFPAIFGVYLVLQINFIDFQLSGMAVLMISFLCFMNLTSDAFLTDSRSGLGNKKLLMSSLSYYFQPEEGFSVLSLSVRGYGRFLREFGPKHAEELAADISDRLKRVKYLSQIFRISEERFVLIGPAASDQRCNDFCQDVISTFSTEWNVASAKIHIGADIIIIPCPSVGENVSETIGIIDYLATLDMDSIKDGAESVSDNGNDVSFVVCDLKMREYIARQNYVFSLLQKACLESGFEYHYQPIYDLDGNYINSAECLIRLYDKKYGQYISPNEFIPIAEKEGFIGIIGRLVLDHACSIIKKAMEQGRTLPTISVNFSARQFYNTELPMIVQSSIRKAGIPASNIKIEITESYLLTNYSAVKNLMGKMMEFGVGFYLDDFGAGYSAVQRYISLPFECVKIDQSFLLNAASNRKADLFLKGMVPSFREMGFSVIFEGVENKELLDYVKKFDGAHVQGFYFSTPIPTDEYKRLCGIKG